MRALWLFVAGCAGGDAKDGTGDTDAMPDCTVAEMSFDIGTGEDAYLDLAEGDPVTIVHGQQGGWHVETAVDVRGAMLDVTVLPAIRSDALDLDVTGAQLPAYVRLVGYDETTCTGASYGVRAFVNTVRDTGPSEQAFVCTLDGLPVTLSVEVFDGYKTAEAEIGVVLEIDPADEDDCP